MAHTARVSEVASYIFNLINDNKNDLQLTDVWLGEQLMIPRDPAAVVQFGPKRRSLVGVQGPGGRVENELNVMVDIHVTKVGVEAEQRLRLEELYEAVEIKIHEDTTLGGIIIHGYFMEWLPGETITQNNTYRTVRGNFVGRSRTLIGPT